MTNFIPVFPLKVVLYPQEALNLHIFEPRYKQLIKECVAEQKTFGIPVVLDSKIEELGTLVRVVEVVKEYENGEMDVRTEGVGVFRILEVIKEIPDKLYSGAIVNYPSNALTLSDTTVAKKVFEEVRRLYSLLNVEEKFPTEAASVISYQIAHFVGLSLQQEYELLGLFEETQRLEYLRRHLSNITPVVQELEEMKARIKRNGHFRDLSLGDLNL